MQLNKSDSFIFMPDQYMVGEALDQVSKLPQEKYKLSLDNIAKKILEHSNEIKRMLEFENEG